MKVSSPKLKKILYFTIPTSKFFLEKNVIYLFSEKNPLRKKYPIFWEMELSSPKIKKFFIFRELIFQDGTFQDQKIKN